MKNGCLVYYLFVLAVSAQFTIMHGSNSLLGLMSDMERSIEQFLYAQSLRVALFSKRKEQQEHPDLKYAMKRAIKKRRTASPTTPSLDNALQAQSNNLTMQANSMSQRVRVVDHTLFEYLKHF